MPSAYRKNGKRTSGPIRKVSYGRCSTDDQKHKDFSTVQNQHEKNRAYIARTGGIHAGEYSDEGKTGTNLNRQDWNRLLADAQAHQFDVVVVTYMSRLGRGKTFTIAEYLLRQAGVTVEMVEETFADDEAGYAQQQVTLLVDGMYPLQVSKWTSTKMQGMVERGYVTGQIPFGYTKQFVESLVTTTHGEDKKPPQVMVPHSDNAPLVRQAFIMAKERSTRSAIEQYLQTMTGQRWSTTRVKTLLMNEAYIGVQNFGNWRNENAHEPLVERDLFNDVQDLLSNVPTRAPRQKSTDKPDDPFRYYLRGRVYCPYCKDDNGNVGCIYTQASAGKSNTHYYVYLRDNKGQTKCPMGRVNANALHFTVLSLIERAARHHTVMHRLIAESQTWKTPPDELKQHEVN